MITRLVLWAAFMLALVAAPARADTPTPAPLEAQANRLVALFYGALANADDFTPSFLAQVPLAQVTALAARLRAENGDVIGVKSFTPRDATEADLEIEYRDALVRAQFAIEPTAPHRFIGLFVTGATRKRDSVDAVIGALKALPGRTALTIARLASNAPAPLAAHNADAPLATGSLFKLFVLDALVGEVAANRRYWADVVPLGLPSLPSGVTQDWPRGTPMTVQTLATQMISISDNTATDTLMTALGRDRVDAARGGSADARPVLLTREAFALKTAANAALRRRWSEGDLIARQHVLRDLDHDVGRIDRRELAGAPLFLDSVEWPATMIEIVGVLDHLRRSKSAPALAILSVNPSLAPDTRARFAYAGYKGGSETGVIAMSWLLQTRSGDWYAVAGAWNDPAAPVDNARFEALMARAVDLVGR